MKNSAIFVFLAVIAGIFSANAAVGSGKLELTADRIAAERGTEAMMATGHVVAVDKPYRLMSDFVERDQVGVYHFKDPTSATTCSNEVDNLHWSVTGEIEYSTDEYVLLRNMWVRMFGIPVMWLPYMYYPLDTDCGFSWMPGYTGRWGAFLLTRYGYHLAGDRYRREDRFSLWGSTRFDLRYKQGIALGEELDWILGKFGQGHFKVYYAWDQSDDHDFGYSYSGWNSANWGSDIPENRYALEFKHRWEVTERDTLRVGGSIYSDSYMRSDFFRSFGWGMREEWRGHDGNEVAWEHLENAIGVGVSASGPLNKFYGGTSRLPEIYLDVNPMPIWSLPLNYESQSRIGYLSRQPAEYASSSQIWGRNPGAWADYETFRFDTYHRITAPFKVAERMSVVPRVAYHGTYWQHSGSSTGDAYQDSLGYGDSEDNTLFRSIFEAGVTFAGRGTAWIDDEWQHMVEPYCDVLAQAAVYSGGDDLTRPYVFDNLDASMDWDDQFAGRGRNLPYSYYGITPGLRNAFRKVDERGNLHTVFDFDFYVALQVNETDSIDSSRDYSRSTTRGYPNYGDGGAMWYPGGRLRWFLDDKTSLGLRAEYDTENERFAVCDIQWTQRLDRKFNYYVRFNSRDHRYWDYAPSPANSGSRDELLNEAKFSLVSVGFEHEICDALVWSPFVRWNCRIGELDSIGSWFDIRTDCLGFRLQVKYDNEYEMIDGYTRDSDVDIGFFIYLRALGPGAALNFGS